MVYQSLKMAWSAIRTNKMRSFLTMLGIIIGVVSLVVLVSLADGATTSVTDQISGMGTNLLTVSISDDKENPIRLSELSDFAENETIDEIAPYARTSVTAKSGYNSDTMNVYGTTGAYYNILDLTLFSGRFIKSVDVENNSYICVINQTAATELIGRNDAVGEYISMNGKKFLIVGVLQEEESVTSSNATETTDVLEAYIPFTTMTRLADNVLYVTTFYASAADDENMNGAETALENMMLDRLSNDEEAFSIVNQSALMETMASVNNTMSLMLGGIAAISLIVGGIGIMNIMLVSVTERTREIGIRKAIGAGRGSIMLQFLIEALMVSLIGCAIGIGLSWTILKIAGYFIDSMTFQLSANVVWIAVGFSVFIGVVFGIYPANKAASKRPIEALRFS